MTDNGLVSRRVTRISELVLGRVNTSAGMALNQSSAGRLGGGKVGVAVLVPVAVGSGGLVRVGATLGVKVGSAGEENWPGRLQASNSKRKTSQGVPFCVLWMIMF